MRKAALLSVLLFASAFVSAEMRKMASDGELLSYDSTRWACVLDQETSLVWEVKTEDKGLQYALNTYTWFDGITGREDGTFSKNCYWGKSCNTKSYVDDINKRKVCGYSDWRLPSRSELNSIVDYYGESDTLIDSNFFPNTQTNSYWTSTVVKGSSKLAYEIPFFYGGSMARDKTIDTFIRLVRSAD